MVDPRRSVDHIVGVLGFWLQTLVIVAVVVLIALLGVRACV